MSNKKTTWKLIVKKTGEVIVKSTNILVGIKDKSMELINLSEDSKYRIQYFENDLLIDTEELTVYFSK
jgi:hypothetical protein